MVNACVGKGKKVPWKKEKYLFEDVTLELTCVTKASELYTELANMALSTLTIPADEILEFII